MMRRRRPGEAADASTGERRRDVRQASLLEVAKLTVGDRSELCRLRDVSAEGLRAELYCPVAKGDRVIIELRTGHSLEGNATWVRGGDMGISFDQPMPISEMLSHCSFDERVTSVRAPRLDIAIDAMLLVDHFRFATEVSNISQTGLKLQLEDEYFDPDTPCTVAIDHLGLLKGEIKWWRDREGGFMFDEAIPYPAWADWRRALHPEWQQVQELRRDMPSWFPQAETADEPQDTAPLQRRTRLFGQRGGGARGKKN